jgi:flavin-binding protein dodecin
VVAERVRVGVEALEPLLADRLGEEIEDLVGALDRDARLWREVNAEGDARPDDRERAVRHRSRRYRVLFDRAGEIVGVNPNRGVHMSSVAKVVTIIGSSPESFAKAADAAVQEAAKTLRGIKGADVITMSAVVENDRITEYRTTVNIAFGVER